MTKPSTHCDFRTTTALKSADTTIHTIGLDIAKASFALHAVDAQGKTILMKVLKRHQLMFFFASLPPARVGLEACASAHHWNYGDSALIMSKSGVPAFAGMTGLGLR